MVFVLPFMLILVYGLLEHWLGSRRARLGLVSSSVCKGNDRLLVSMEISFGKRGKSCGISVRYVV